MEIKILTMEAFDNRAINSVGSSRIRGRWLANNWNECEEYKIGDKPDVMIYQKAYWKDHMRDFKGLKFFDLCDPDWLEGRPVKEVSQYVDAFVVPTYALKEGLEQFITKPVFIIPDRFELSEFPKPKLDHNGVARTCVWWGYNANSYVLDPALPYLDKYNLDLTIISDAGLSGTKKFVKYDYETVHSEIKRCDIALLPPGGGPRFKYKSNNKAVEAQLLGMPVAKSAEDLEKFLNPTERDKEAKAKYIIAKNEYDIKQSVKEWKQIISDLQKS